MKESNRKIAIFAIVFVICAVLLLLAMPTQKIPADHEHNINVASVDSLNKILNLRLTELEIQHKTFPDSVDIIVQIANIYYDLDNTEKALEFYEMALNKKPEDATALTDCAVMYFKRGDSDKALEYLDKAINIQPDLAQAWFNKGLILMTTRERHSEGLETWKQFIKLAPESEEAKLIKNQIEAIEAAQK